MSRLAPLLLSRAGPVQWHDIRPLGKPPTAGDARLSGLRRVRNEKGMVGLEKALVKSGPGGLYTEVCTDGTDSPLIWSCILASGIFHYWTHTSLGRRLLLTAEPNHKRAACEALHGHF